MSATKDSLDTISELDVFAAYKQYKAAEYEDFLAYSSDQAAEETSTLSSYTDGN